MAGHHTTFSIKKEREGFSPGCGFRYSSPSERGGGGSVGSEDFEIDMDLSKFLGEPDIGGERERERKRYCTSLHALINERLILKLKNQRRLYHFVKVDVFLKVYLIV